MRIVTPKKPQDAIKGISHNDFPVLIEDGGYIFQICCDCGLRHVWSFRIIEGGQIFIDCVRDQVGTDMFRFIDKEVKNAERKTKAKKR